MMSRRSIAGRVQRAMDEVEARVDALPDDIDWSRSRLANIGFTDSPTDPQPVVFGTREDLGELAIGRVIIHDQDNPYDLARVLHEKGVAQRITARGASWYLPKLVQDVLTHERQHRTAARKLGAADVDVGLELSARKLIGRGTTFVVSSFFARPYDIAWDTLEYGSFLMYPEAMGGPSSGDVREAERVGLPGDVQEVGALIVARNAILPADIAPLPIPLTYRQ